MTKEPHPTEVSQSYESRPDMMRLTMAARALAAAMAQARPNERSLQVYLEAMLYTAQGHGGHDTWACLLDGLITEVETRNLVMARCATWMSDENCCREYPVDEWLAPMTNISSAFDLALFGRAARPVPGIDP